MRTNGWAKVAGFSLLAFCAVLLGAGLFRTLRGAPAETAPKFKFDPDWPKPLPTNGKIRGITGLAVDKDDNVWALDRPNDLTDIELEAELNPPIADCCKRPPAMIHFDKEGNVIGSFDPPQGHGMAVDSKGFAYIGNVDHGIGNVRKDDEKTGKLIAELPHTPTTTPMIVGGIEEVRLDEPAHELYAADNYLGGRVMVFDLDTFAFKRGWGAYGHKLSEISTDDKDREYTPNGPMPKEFRGHLTLNVSHDGLVYAADRMANRIHVFTRDGKFLKEFKIAEWTAVGGSTGGVMFSPDKEQRLLYISDLTNNHIWFLNREDGKILGKMGQMGENGGQFFGLHMEAVDSKGIIYTGEVFAGERVQRFLPVK